MHAGVRVSTGQSKPFTEYIQNQVFFFSKEFQMHEIGIRLIDAGSGSMLRKVNSSHVEL
jgi:hypothetical protein